MKKFRITYATKGVLTFSPTYRWVKAENEKQAIEIFNHEKREKEYFIAIKETTKEQQQTKQP